MVIENIMYFALGLLVAGLISLIILPAVWKRAVRLTKRRIEAATPITMAEFRADKDQLRAEFALSTRRLEMNVETLRKRLAEQLGDVNQKRSDLGQLKAERDQHLLVVKELEQREAELRSRVAELEREGTDLAQRLRMRDRELETRSGEISTLRDSLRGGLPRGTAPDGTPLSGDYDEDVDRLTTALAIERKRAAFLEDQAKSLISRLESSDRRGAEATAAIAQMREALASRDDKKAADAENLVAAEARIASAENRLNALLAETSQVVEQSEGRAEQLLADKLSLEAEVEALRKKVSSVESTILADWDTERLEEAYLREKLNDIAASVSRLVYAVDNETPVIDSTEESLFDRVQRFADDGEGLDALPVQPAKGERKGGSVTDRMAALREIQGR
jgi:DNA repair exonuclease SbcCD ATPase subunit